MNRELKYALGKTIPILFSYLFLSMAFGIMMNQAGFAFYWAYLVSLTVYTGAFQFVIVSFLSAGALLGQLIPFDFEGVDFCMTALFVTILIDQWRKSGNHAPAVIGGISAVVFLLAFGASRFMLPSLMVTTAFLLIFTPGKRKMEEAVSGKTISTKPVSGKAAIGKTISGKSV